MLHVDIEEVHMHKALHAGTDSMSWTNRGMNSVDGVLFNEKYTALTSYLVVQQLSTGNGIYMYLLMNKYDIATMMLSRLSSVTFMRSFLTFDQDLYS